MKALSIKDLSFGYGEHVVLKNISLEVEQGSYVSLIGHNGSGKTTLAKLIVGLFPFDSGEITISDVLLSKESLNEIRNKVAIVFQNPDNQFIGITVEDDIAFSLENRNVPRDEMQKLVREYAEKVGMLEFLTKEPAYLSGGQKEGQKYRRYWSWSFCCIWPCPQHGRLCKDRERKGSRYDCARHYPPEGD